MRETRLSGSEGGGTKFNRFSLPLSSALHFCVVHPFILPFPVRYCLKLALKPSKQALLLCAARLNLEA